MTEAIPEPQSSRSVHLSKQRLGFLDGLRGWAALFVLFCHVFSDGLPVEQMLTPKLSRLLPFNGLMAVFVFFVVSGFSLSVKYLETGDAHGLIRIASARYLRLAIPIFAVCALVHLAMMAGLIDPAALRLERFRPYLNFEPTLSHLLTFGFFDVFFKYDIAKSYVLPLWTMSIEFYGSALILATVFLLRPLPVRPLLLVGLSVAIAALGRTPEMAMLSLFPVGAAIGDLYNRGWLDCRPAGPGLALLAIGASVPLLLKDSVFAWGLVGATSLTLGCIMVGAVRRWLQSPLSRQLGRLSFPLYLIHGPVIWFVGEPLTRIAGQTTAARLSIDIAVVFLSLAAAYVFLPVNQAALQVSRAFGQRVSQVMLGSPKKQA